MQLWVMRRSQGLPVDTGAELANAGEMHRSKILRRRTERIWRKKGCSERRRSCGTVAVVCILLKAKAMVKIRVSPRVNGSSQDCPGCTPCSVVLTKVLLLSSGSKMRINKVQESELHLGQGPIWGGSHFGGTAWMQEFWMVCDVDKESSRGLMGRSPCVQKREHTLLGAAGFQWMLIEAVE